MKRTKIVFKDCTLTIDGKVVGKEDELVRMAGDLSLGKVPKVIKDLKLDEQTIQSLEAILTEEIFINGKCLCGDEEIF